LVVIGNLDGQLAAAARLAMDGGAPVRHADGIETAVALCTDKGADLLIVDAAIDIRGLGARLHAAGIAAPVVACGTESDTGTAVAAIHAGAREYIPLTPDPEVIAAILAAVADDGHDPGGEAPASAGQDHGEIPFRLARKKRAEDTQLKAALAAGTVTCSLVGRTVADVERDLILETLKRCFGNRTHAASILGISIRTLRNKLTVYAAEGIAVPPPNHGDLRGAA
jgi:DNA-binding NtrC family response regulator